MELQETEPPFMPGFLRDAFQNRRVFVTGHTGFKGSWLTLWLSRLGAHVTGYALPPAKQPNCFEVARVGDCLITHHEADIRDFQRLQTCLLAAKPEVVLHLAAQPLVRESYRAPSETFAINVQGTFH